MEAPETTPPHKKKVVRGKTLEQTKTPCPGWGRCPEGGRGITLKKRENQVFRPDDIVLRSLIMGLVLLNIEK